MLEIDEAQTAEIAREMYSWAKDLFPLCRSLTGNGVRQTLAYLKKLLPGLAVHEVPSGSRACDWIVPDEWNIRDAYVMDDSGRKIIDFAKSNLHVVGYSVPVDAELSLEELEPHLHSLPEQPDAIPYITSYYERRWGFCLAHRERQNLRPGKYRVRIESSHTAGSLSYGELLLPGHEQREILLSTYICHPSLANNELSGPVMAAGLARWLAGRSDRRYSYRIVFVPESIGAIVYVSRNLAVLKERVIAGFILTCVGDERAYSFLPSRLGGTLADRAAECVLARRAPQYKRYSFLDRGSDEQQYCSPGVDLPVVSIMRSKYGEYPEYHTSLDNLDLISPQGLGGAFDALRECLALIEQNRTWRLTTTCMPQLGRRGMYPSLSGKTAHAPTVTLLNILSYCDGRHDLLALAERIREYPLAILPAIERLEAAGLLERVAEG
jgi:aminopeptidase-like protein